MSWLRALVKPTSAGLHGAELDDYLAKRLVWTKVWFYYCLIVFAITWIWR